MLRRLSQRALSASAWVALVCVLEPTPLVAQGPAGADDEGARAAFGAVHGELDPLELARVAQRVGDEVVLAALADAAFAPHSRLRAVRAAPFLRAPEAALVPLAVLAAGRDPALAPAAALAAHRIAGALAPAALDARELDPGSLEEPARLFAALRDDATARPDLRTLAAFAVAALESLCGAPQPVE